MAALASTPVLASPVGAQPGGPAAAWVVADAGTGRLLESVNGHVPLPPASLTKVLTALTAVWALPPSATVPVSHRAAAMPPTKVGMRAGDRWSLDHTLHALLLSSANDAAMALAERVSGSAEAFAAAMGATAARLGLRHSPVFHDPAGLDGAKGVGGGNLVSAEDVAIVARAALGEPRIAPLVARREYRFTAPDGRERRLVNHNKLLGSYPGAIGVKTGYTRRAGRCLAAAAHRDGRTVVVVVLSAQDVYATATALLDRGFASPAAPSPPTSGRRPGGLLPTLPPPPALPGLPGVPPPGDTLVLATASHVLPTTSATLGIGGVVVGGVRVARRRRVAA